MTATPELWADDLQLVQRALLLDEPAFDYGDGGKSGEDWQGTIAANWGDRRYELYSSDCVK